jgi:hypothetical protein
VKLTSPLEKALEVDLALSERQVWRHYGLNLGQCEQAGLSITRALIAPTAKMRHPREVAFVSLEPQTRVGFELRHLAGVAEMRHSLYAAPEDWQVIEHAAITSPDAIWYQDLETWAVEFDAGSYSLRTVLEKQQHFRAAFDGQVWGVASEARAATLYSVLKARLLVIHSF